MGESPQLPDILADVNAEIRAVAGRSAAKAGEWEFVCECGAPGCAARVTLTLADYEVLAENGAPVLAHGHTQSAAAKALHAQAQHQVARAKKNAL